MKLYKVYIEECADECSPGAYLHADGLSLEDARRTRDCGRMVYPSGAVWIEDEGGNVIQ